MIYLNRKAVSPVFRFVSTPFGRIVKKVKLRGSSDSHFKYSASQDKQTGEQGLKLCPDIPVLTTVQTELTWRVVSPWPDPFIATEEQSKPKGHLVKIFGQ